MSEVKEELQVVDYTYNGIEFFIRVKDPKDSKLIESIAKDLYLINQCRAKWNDEE